MTATFRVKNYDKFQHYKDRAPPWIKLYSALLENYEFGLLPDASKAHLIAIWLLASRYNNVVPLDKGWVGKRINATDDVDLDALIKAGFLLTDQSRSDVLAPGKQDAMPEREKEAEGETEGETEKNTPLAGGTPEVAVEQPRQVVPKHKPVPAPKREDHNTAIPAALDRSKYPEAFEHLWTVYRAIAPKNATKVDAHRAWHPLSADEKVLCFQSLQAYVVEVRKERAKRPDYAVKHLSTFINRKSWETMLDQGGEAALKPTTWVLRDSPQWAICEARHCAEKGLKSAPTIGGEGGAGWSFPSEWLDEERKAS